MSGRKRVERGLFGIPKRKSILFTFRPRDGEECSSDSEDSDYFPGRRSTDEDDDVEMIKKAKRKLSKKAKLDSASTSAGKKQTRRTKTVKEKASLSKDRASNKNGAELCLPPEVMLRIFSYVIKAEGITKFLPRVSRVCKEWHQLAGDPSLFEKLDLNIQHVKLTRQKLEHLLNHDVSQCKHFSLSGQTAVQSSAIEFVLSSMPRLVTLDLFGCINLKSDTVKQIPEKCSALQSIDLSNHADFNRNITYPAMEAMIRGCGPGLVELRLAGISAVKQYHRQLIKVVEENCPNLEELDLRIYLKVSDTWQRSEADMAALAQNCPKLRELRLDGFNFVDKTRTEDPYPQLNKLQIYSQRGQRYSPPERPAFYKMFGGVQRLSELSISSTNLLPDKLTKWVKAVEHLYLSDMKWRDSESSCLVTCVDAWLTSLKTLDLSFNKLTDNVLDQALTFYLAEPDPSFEGFPLQALNLSNTNITASTVIQLVKACKKLEEIDLTSCRELPRGSKRIFKKNEFKLLLKCLRSEACDDRRNNVVDDSSDDDEEDGPSSMSESD